MAWKNQKGKKLDQRTCKHLKSHLGEEYERLRMDAASEVSHDDNKANVTKRKSAAMEENVELHSPAIKKIKRNEYDEEGEEEISLAELGATVNRDRKKSFKGKAKMESKRVGSPKQDESNKPTEVLGVNDVKNGAHVALEEKEVTKEGDGEGHEIQGNVNMKEKKVKEAPALLLANKYDLEKDKPDVVGYDFVSSLCQSKSSCMVGLFNAHIVFSWWMSEKLDGVRVFWDGEGQLLSRLGNAFSAPQWFIDSKSMSIPCLTGNLIEKINIKNAELPRGITLDGELWLSRGSFSQTISIVKTQRSEKWGDILFKV